MSNDRKLLKQALDAWHTATYGHPSHHKAMLLAMTALGAALAEPDVPEVCFGNMSDTLPPLPESDYGLCFYDEGGCHPAYGTGYTADQMRSYAAAALAAERERQHEQMRQLMSELIFDEPAAVAEPLTDEQIDAACVEFELWNTPLTVYDRRIARAIERAHGISAPASAPKETT